MRFFFVPKKGIFVNGFTAFLSLGLFFLCIMQASTFIQADDFPGCTDSSYIEYNAEATVNDGSCVTPIVRGCTDSSASNYNSSANQDDGSCVPFVYGCTDSNYMEYNSSANANDGSCATAIVSGCTDSSASNYNSSANQDDGSCMSSVYGCTDSNYMEYNASANTSDGSCTTLIVNGCTDSAASNYSSSANTDDGSCTYVIYGCTDSNYMEYNASANTSDGSCTTPIVHGCTDPAYLEYSASANTNNGSCTTLIVRGCTDSNYVEYNSSANTSDGSCSTTVVRGCTNSGYLEYNASANTDDGSCATAIISGCTDSTASNYNSSANQDDGSCVSFVSGCTDPDYLEYNASANMSDGSCATLIEYGCTDPAYFEYNASANASNGSCSTLIMPGCTDSTALNYNSSANQDDSSCTYPIYGCTNIVASNFNSQATDDDGSCTFIAPQLTLIRSTNSAGSYTEGDSINIYGYFGREIHQSSSLDVVLNNGAVVALNNLIGTSTLQGFYIVGANEIISMVNASSTQNVHILDMFSNTYTSEYSIPLSPYNISDSVHLQIVASENNNNNNSEDNQNNNESNNNNNETPPSDTTAPQISEIVYTIGTSSVTVAWITDENATSTLRYGLTDGYDATFVYNFGTSHTFTISNLTPNTTYHHELSSVDSSGNVSTTQDATFTTLNVGSEEVVGTSTVATTTANTVASTGSWIFSVYGGGSSVSTYIPPVTFVKKDVNVNLISQNKPFTFNTDLQASSGTSTDVQKLQKLLNVLGFTVARTGPGSVGKETFRFGAATRAALVRFQKSHNIKPSLGFFGPVTRFYINNLMKNMTVDSKNQ